MNFPLEAPSLVASELNDVNINILLFVILCLTVS